MADYTCPACLESFVLNPELTDSTPSCPNCQSELELSPTHSPTETLDMKASFSSAPIRENSKLLLPGKIGKYTVTRKIGRGGMGEVFLGHHPSFNIPVAIKLLPPELIEQNADFLKRFIEEAHTTARINHPAIVRVYDADFEDGYNFIVMEFVDGQTVRDKIKDQGEIPEEEAVDILTTVTEALVESSNHQIIHRDIKPDNIMIDKAGHTKLCDLGLAKRIDDSDLNITVTGMPFGTPAYISPEQAKNSKAVDIRSDIYSLGATFYHMVTGEIPFSGASSAGVVIKHIQDPRPDPRSIKPELSNDLCTVIGNMMAIDPKDRYQTPDQLLMDLRLLKDRLKKKSEGGRGPHKRERFEPIQSTISIAPAGIPNESSRPNAHKQKRTVIAWATIAIVGLIFGAIFFLVFSDQGAAGLPDYSSDLFTGIVLHYPFEQDEGAQISDRSGKGHRAKRKGGEWTAEGRYGGGIHFSDLDDRIIIEGYKGILGDGARTIAFWFKDDGNEEKSSILVWGGYEQPGSHFDICFYERTIRLDVHEGDIVASSAGRGLMDQAWHHVAVTYPEGGTVEAIRFYIDGQPDRLRINRIEATDRLDTVSDKNVMLSERNLLAVLDELMIWERELSAEEVGKIFRGAY